MEINLVTLEKAVAAITNLYSITNLTQDRELLMTCNQMIKTLHEKVILPAAKYKQSYAEDGDRHL